MNENPSLNLLYVHAGWIGYGRVGMNLAEQMQRKGIDVFDHLEGCERFYSLDGAFVPPALGSNEWAGDRVDTEGRRAGKSNVVCWISVPSHGTGWYEGQIPTLLTMWEGMSLPETFRQSFHEFETVVCPSMQNLELFSRYHDNVKYVPLGIDPDVWHYQERQMPTKEFRFLIGGSGKRKGTDLAVKAFKKLWGKTQRFDGPIPTLTMKNPKGETFYGDRISTIGGYLDLADEVGLYANAHCYLQPSRGEGFGLQPLQAIAQGCPTILTDAHGHEAFSQYGIGINSTPQQSDYFIFGDAGDWWEPDLDELCEAMIDVYENYALHAAQAKTDAPIVAEKFSWSHVTDLFLDALGRDRLGPYEGSGEWHRVEEKKYKVVTNQNHYCEIAGNQFQFYRGNEYWQSADLKRILFEAGKLDPVCIDEHSPEASGLTDAQVLRLGKYRAQFELCPNCGRPLDGAPVDYSAFEP